MKKIYLTLGILVIALLTLLVLQAKTVWQIDQLNNAPVKSHLSVPPDSTIEQTFLPASKEVSAVLLKTSSTQSVSLQVDLVHKEKILATTQTKTKPVFPSSWHFLNHEYSQSDLAGLWLPIYFQDTKVPADKPVVIRINNKGTNPLQLLREKDKKKYPSGGIKIDGKNKSGNIGFISLASTDPIAAARYHLIDNNGLQPLLAILILPLILLTGFAWQKNNYNKATVIFLAVMAIIYTLPLYENMTLWGTGDWQEAGTYYAAVKHSLTAGQLPGWNPYLCGGTPLWADPLGYIPSTALVLSLLFGTLLGIKLATTITVFIGLTGFYTLARWFKFTRASSLVIAVLSMLNGFFTAHILTGHTLWLSWGWVPWILFFFLASFQKRWLIVPSGLLYVWLLFTGPTYFPAYLMIILPLIGFGFLWKKHGWRLPLKQIIYFGLIVISIGAIKWVPMTYYLSEVDNKLEEAAGIPLEQISKIFIIRDISTGAHPKLGDEIIWNEYSAYVGWPALILIIFGALLGIYHLRKSRYKWPLLIIIILFGSVTFTTKNGVNFFEYLPILRELHYPSRAIGILLIIFAFAAGYALNLLPKKTSHKRAASAFSLLIAVIIFADLSLAATAPFANLFSKASRKYEGTSSFEQVGGSYNHGLHIVQAGHGALDFCPPHARYWRPKANISPEQPFLIDNSHVTLKSFSPNIINLKTAPRDETITVTLNQKYDSGWRSKNARIQKDKQGRMQIVIPPAQTEQIIKLKYHVPGRLIGGIISTLGLLGIALLATKGFRRPFPSLPRPV